MGTGIILNNNNNKKKINKQKENKTKTQQNKLKIYLSAEQIEFEIYNLNYLLSIIKFKEPKTKIYK